MPSDDAQHQDWSDKEVFTTGEAARVCGVSQQTIIRCFDSGRLAGFRVPGSRFRRIPRADLLSFMKDNGISASVLGRRCPRVLIVDPDPRVIQRVIVQVSETLGADAIEAHGADGALQIGFQVAQVRPEMIVVTRAPQGVDQQILGALLTEHTKVLGAPSVFFANGSAAQEADAIAWISAHLGASQDRG